MGGGTSSETVRNADGSGLGLLRTMLATLATTLATLLATLLATTLAALLTATTTRLPGCRLAGR